MLIMAIPHFSEVPVNFGWEMRLGFIIFMTKLIKFINTKTQEKLHDAFIFVEYLYLKKRNKASLSFKNSKLGRIKNSADREITNND